MTDESFGREEGPMIPPKSSVRSTLLLETEEPGLPPPKRSHNTEAEVNARLGIVRRRPPPVPEVESDSSGQHMEIKPGIVQNLPGEENPVISSYTNINNSFKPNSNRELSDQSSSMRSINLADVPSQLINEPVNSVAETIKLGAKQGKAGAPVPAPRSLPYKKIEITTDLKRVDRVESSNIMGLNSNKSKASSYGSQESLTLITDSTSASIKSVMVPASRSEVKGNPVQTMSGNPQQSFVHTSEVRNSVANALSAYETVSLKQRDTSKVAENRPALFVGSNSEDTSEDINRPPRKLPGKLKVDGFLAQRITMALTQRPTSTAPENPDLERPISTRVERVSSVKSKNNPPLSPEAGAMSDDCISDGGEFYDDDEYDVEFSRPSEEVLLKSIPIVASQQHKVTEKKGYLFKYTSQKGTLSKLASPWQQRWVVLDSDSLKYFSTNKSYVSKRVIPVCTMNNLEQDIRNGETHPFRFRLKTIDRVYRFAAETADDLSWWTSLLMRSIIGAKSTGFKPGGYMFSPNVEGFVRMDGVRGKRYLAIKNGLFCFYNTQKDFTVFSPIHQVQLQLGSVKDMGKGKLVLQTPQVAFTFLFDTQEELMTWKIAFEVGISYALGDNKVLDEVYTNASNRHCADCGAPGPEWAAINMGITLCQNCAGVHRTMSNARVRSLRMDSKVWTQPLIQLMKTIGNNNANTFWQSLIQRHSELIESDVDMPARVLFINSKYKEKRFCDLHPLHGQQSALNELLCRAVQQSNVLETMRLAFSGADVSCSCSTFGSEITTPYQLAEEARQSLQMEFLMHNGGDPAYQPKMPEPVQPPLPPKADVNANCESTYSGYLYKGGSNIKGGYSKRWFILKSGILTSFENEKGGDIKDAIDRRDFGSITVATDEKVPFALELSTGSQQGRVYLLASESEEERLEWITRLAMSFAAVTLGADEQLNSLQRGGMVYLKFGMLQEWIRTWIHISGWMAYVYSKTAESCTAIDLRKAVSIKYLPPAERCADSNDNGAPIFIDIGSSRLLYIQGENSRETESWFNFFQKAMTESDNTLSHQQLTLDDVPVIVDRLIDFVTTFGLRSEGVYRQSAQNSVVTRLLEQISAGPQSFRLRIEDYQVNDAATALKRFLRNLDDPVLTRALYERWMELPGIADPEVKLNAYKQLLGELPQVNYSTLKRLIIHLVKVAEYSADNLMNITNLSTIFGPVLLVRELESPSRSSFALNSNDANVVRDMLENHSVLFESSDEARLRELQLDKARQQFDRLLSKQVSADDIMLHIYINNRDGKSISVQVSSTTKASEVLSIVIEKAGLIEPNNGWLLQEVICNDELGQGSGKLERPIHGSELVGDVIRRWVKWPEDMCQNSYIAVRPSTLYNDIFIDQTFNPAVPIGGELKYTAKKNFKKCIIDLSQSVLTCRKDKSDNAAVSWNVNDLVIFIGIPLKRAATSQRCGFTFVSIKDQPNSGSFGHSVSCSTDKELYRWLAAIYKSQHTDGWSWSWNKTLSKLTKSSVC